MDFPSDKEIWDATEILPFIFPGYDSEDFDKNILVGMIIVRNRVARATARILSREEE